MTLHKLLKVLHVAGTLWLIVCAGFLLIMALRQAGAGWWVIFSVSGFSGIAFLLLTSVYLFAVFRGVVRKQLTSEHLWTSSAFYLLFYDASPFLGTLAGLISAGPISASSILEWLSLAAEGTLIMTFLVWILGDPLLGLMEAFLPSCAAARRERLAAEAQTRLQREENRRRLLEQIQVSQRMEQEQWEQELLPLAQRLLRALEQNLSGAQLRQEAVEIGACAWQKGGINCMQHLLRLVNRLLEKKGMSPLPHPAFWWEGIGTWRKPSLKEVFTQKPNPLFWFGGTVRKLFFFGPLWLINALCPAADWYVHPAGSADPNGSQHHPFASIQQALDAAQSGDRILLLPGVYSGPGNFNLNPQGKSLTIQSTEPTNLEIAASTIIDPNGLGRGFVLNQPDGSPFILQGLTIRNAVCSQEDNPPHGAALSCFGVSLTVRFCIFESCNADGGWGGAFYGQNSQAVFEHCLLTANQGRYGGAAAVNLNSSVSFTYCTITGNQAWFGGGGIMTDFDSSVNLRNSIVFYNGITVSPHNRGRQIQIRSSSFSASYSCLSNLPEDIYVDNDSTASFGPGILHQEPEFALHSNLILPQNRDFHLRSRYGRWEPQTQTWVLDPVTSPCINAGDPNDDWSAEPWPNGKRVNLGFYGGTNQASKFGNPADFNIDGTVDLLDLSEMLEIWLNDSLSDIHDLTQDGRINMNDFEEFSRHWLHTNTTKADFDTDGDVDLADLALFSEEWLTEAPVLQNLDGADRVDINDFAVFAQKWLWKT